MPELLPLDVVLAKAEAAALLADRLAVIADDDTAVAQMGYTVGVMAASQSAAAAQASRAWTAYAHVRLLTGELVTTDPDAGDPLAAIRRQQEQLDAMKPRR